STEAGRVKDTPAGRAPGRAPEHRRIRDLVRMPWFALETCLDSKLAIRPFGQEEAGPPGSSIAELQGFTVLANIAGNAGSTSIRPGGRPAHTTLRDLDLLEQFRMTVEDFEQLDEGQGGLGLAVLVA